MNLSSYTIHEQTVSEAFNKQASLFDELYGSDVIIQYKRNRVRDHLLQYVIPGSNILELNAGTGDDAIFFAQQGYTVHATDISLMMQTMLKEKVKLHELQDKITYEICSYTNLENLHQQGPYDHVFSNFAGLNCTNELGKVLDSFSFLLNPAGFATLVIMPKFCLWEFLLFFKGKFKSAFRRFTGRKGAKAHIEGKHFRCWYYNPSFIRNHLKNSFDVIKIEGLCSFVPPSYIGGFAEKYSRLFEFLKKKEQKYKSKWPWKSIGDYFIITLQRKN